MSEHIDRNELIRMIIKNPFDEPNARVAQILSAILKAPSLEAEWKINCDGYYPYCSGCGNSSERMTKYCSECGARMKEK